MTESYNVNSSGVFAATHSSELPFAYKSAQYALSAAGKSLVEQMHRAWVNFIKYGDPNGADGNGLSVAWPEYDTSSRRIIYFDKTVSQSAVKDTVDAPILKKIFSMMYGYSF